jgi:ribA/ribD-fused uncharacterized protein
MINNFDGEYGFLSNSWPCRVKLDGMLYYPTVEHAYQAAKTDDPAERREVRMAFSPQQARRVGQKVMLRGNWEFIRLQVMEDLLRQKFSKGSDFAARLLKTGDEELIDGNTRQDAYWGVCDGLGENQLGKMLMTIRKDLRSQ